MKGKVIDIGGDDEAMPQKLLPATNPPCFMHVDRHLKPELAPWLWHDVTTAVGVMTDRQSQLTETSVSWLWRSVTTPTAVVTSLQSQGAGSGFE